MIDLIKSLVLRRTKDTRHDSPAARRLVNPYPRVSSAQAHAPRSWNHIRDIEPTNFDPAMLPEATGAQQVRAALVLALRELQACGRGSSDAAIAAATVLARNGGER